MRRVAVVIYFVLLALSCQSTTQWIFSSKISGVLSSDQILRDLDILRPISKMKRFERLVEQLVRVDGLSDGLTIEGIATKLIGIKNWRRKIYLRRLGYLKNENIKKMVYTLLPLMGKYKWDERLYNYIFIVARRNSSPQLVKERYTELVKHVYAIVKKKDALKNIELRPEIENLISEMLPLVEKK